MTTARFSVLAITACLAASASAQTRSSFLDGGTFSGIDIAESNGGLTYDVTFNPGAQFHYAGLDYDITDVFGFWNLSDDDDLTSTINSFVDGDGATWDADASNSGTGGIAGWKTNPNTGITSGQAVQFNYDALSTGLVEHFGLHVRIDGLFPGTDGNTGYATFTDIPTPGATALLGIAGLVAARRRR